MICMAALAPAGTFEAEEAVCSFAAARDDREDDGCTRVCDGGVFDSDVAA